MNLAPIIGSLGVSVQQNINNSDDIAFQGFVFGVLATCFAIALCKLLFFIIDYFKD